MTAVAPVQLGRRRPRAAIFIILLGTLGLLASGCSSGGSERPETVLRVLMTDDWVTPPFLSAVRDFERAHPNVRVEVDKSPISHMLDQVAVTAGTRDAPDVVQAHAFSAAAQGLAQPLDDLWGTSVKMSEFLPGALDDVTWAGRLFGVPLDTNALFLIHDKERFASANVPLPARGFTFQDFEAAAKALSTPDGSRRALAIPTSTWWTYGWIRANGGEVLQVGNDGQVQLMLDAPRVVSALEYLSRLVKANLAFPPRAADSHSDDALALFRSGSAATLASGSWDLAILEGHGGGDRYEASPLPAGGAGAGSVMGGSSLFVPTGSSQRRLAFDFMAHLVSDRYALRFAKEQGRLPVRPRLYEDTFFKNPKLKAVVDQLTTATPFKLTAFPEAHDVFAGAVDQVLREGKDAAEVLKAAQERAQALVPSSP